MAHTYELRKCSPPDYPEVEQWLDGTLICPDLARTALIPRKLARAGRRSIERILVYRDDKPMAYASIVHNHKPPLYGQAELEHLAICTANAPLECFGSVLHLLCFAMVHRGYKKLGIAAANITGTGSMLLQESEEERAWTWNQDRTWLVIALPQ